jgi:hypothetical protein
MVQWRKGAKAQWRGGVVAQRHNGITVKKSINLALLKPIGHLFDFHLNSHKFFNRFNII